MATDCIKGSVVHRTDFSRPARKRSESVSDCHFNAGCTEDTFLYFQDGNIFKLLRQETNLLLTFYFPLSPAACTEFI